MMKLLLISVAASMFASSAVYGRSMDIEDVEQFMGFKDAMDAIMKKGTVRLMKCYNSAVTTTEHLIDLYKLAIKKADGFLAVEKPNEAMMKEWATQMGLYYKALNERLLKDPVLKSCRQYYRKHLPIAMQKKMTASIAEMWEHTTAMKMATLSCPTLAHKVTKGIKALNEKHLPFAQRFVNHSPSRKDMDKWVVRFGPYWTTLHWKHPAVDACIKKYL